MKAQYAVKTLFVILPVMIIGAIIVSTTHRPSGGPLPDKNLPAQLATQLADNPNDPHTYLALGEYYAKCGQTGAAEHYLRRALELEPGFTDAKISLGAILYSSGRWQESVDVLRDAAKDAPDNPRVHNNLGLSLYALHKFDEAADELEQAVRLEPNGIDQLVNLASVRAAQNKFDVARTYLHKALTIDPESVAARVNLVQLEQTVSRVNDPHSKERSRAMAATAKMSYDELVNMLKNGSDSERAIAVWRIGKLSNPAAAAVLRTALADSDGSVRANAIWALSELNDPADIDRFRSMLTDQTQQVRVFAAAALAQSGYRDGVMELVAALREKDPSLRQIAHQSLCALAGQNLGLDYKTWEKWAENGS